MQPLHRQDTHSSLRSWWSDSNSMLRHSPTVNLHAMAKPLMRFMYHRQALGYIEENQDAPLSAELLEIYSSYLSCKYVSRRTQRLILDHLFSRVSMPGRDRFGQDAQEILCSPVLNQIPHIHGDRDPDCFWSIKKLIRALVVHNFGWDWQGELVLGSNWPRNTQIPLALWRKLRVLLSEPVISEVTHVLRNQKGLAAAQALLKSANTSVIRFTLELIAEFIWPHASKMSPPKLVFDIIPTVWAKLSCDDNDSVQIALICTLSHIAEHPDGSAAIIAANILDDLQHWFDAEICNTSSPRCCQASWLIQSLARHGFTIPHIVHANVIDKLVYHTSCPFGLQNIDTAVWALHAISMHPEGAAAVLPAMSEMAFFNLAVILLDSHSDRTYLIHVCTLISSLAKDGNSASVLLRSSHLVAALESLLRRGTGSGWNDENIFLEAASTLIQLHKWSGTEKLRDIIAAIRLEGVSTAEFLREDSKTRLLEEIRAAELTFRF